MAASAIAVRSKKVAQAAGNSNAISLLTSSAFGTENSRKRTIRFSILQNSIEQVYCIQQLAGGPDWHGIWASFLMAPIR
jgi:hypothetical protein